MMKKILLIWALLMGLMASAMADAYIYSNQEALNIYYECEDFDGAIPEALAGVFDSRLKQGDEILSGTLCVRKYHNQPDTVQNRAALLAVRRAGKILLLGASDEENGWRCAVETDDFFAPGERFDVTVLPDHGQSGEFRGASLALACGEEAFLVTVSPDGSVNLNEYRAEQADGSTLEIRVDEGALYASRYRDGIQQESGSVKGVLSGRLCGWTAEAFPRSCAQVNALEGADLPTFAEDEAMIFGVNFRERPTGGSDSMGRYTARVRVLDRAAGEVTSWYQVQVGDTVGWVSGTYVCWPENERDAFSIASYLSEVPRFAKTPRSAARRVMLRKAPDGEAAMQLPAGTILQIICENDGWLHVILPGKQGWAMDWNGRYGYVRSSDVITGVSLADVGYP